MKRVPKSRTGASGCGAGLREPEVSRTLGYGLLSGAAPSSTSELRIDRGIHNPVSRLTSISDLGPSEFEGFSLGLIVSHFMLAVIGFEMSPMSVEDDPTIVRARS